jgi:hypothetical protein
MNTIFLRLSIRTLRTGRRIELIRSLRKWDLRAEGEWKIFLASWDLVRLSPLGKSSTASRDDCCVFMLHRILLYIYIFPLLLLRQTVRPGLLYNFTYFTFVRTIAILNVSIFWNIAPSSPYVNRRFGRLFYFHLQDPISADQKTSG